MIAVIVAITAMIIGISAFRYKNKIEEKAERNNEPNKTSRFLSAIILLCALVVCICFIILIYGSNNSGFEMRMKPD